MNFPPDELEVRLVGGQSPYEGRVEVLYNGNWGTVCDDSWGIKDAHVICRQLGFSGADDFKDSAYFGAGEGDIVLDDVECAGNESNIVYCPRREIGSNNCGHYEDAGVICSQGERLSFHYTGWPRKNGTGYFPQYVDAITEISL